MTIFESLSSARIRVRSVIVGVDGRNMCGLHLAWILRDCFSFVIFTRLLYRMFTCTDGEKISICFIYFLLFAFSFAPLLVQLLVMRGVGLFLVAR